MSLHSEIGRVSFGRPGLGIVILAILSRSGGKKRNINIHVIMFSKIFCHLLPKRPTTVIWKPSWRAFPGIELMAPQKLFSKDSSLFMSSIFVQR